MLDYRAENWWALILGGSSGFGLATAHRLARAGVNLCLVHRDRKGSMARIEEEFKKIKANNIELLTINTNALDEEARTEILAKLAGVAGQGKVRLLLHSIAIGNLKLLAPQAAEHDHARKETIQKLAHELRVDSDQLESALARTFEAGAPALSEIAPPPPYDSELTLEDEDVAGTIYAMGTSLLPWAKDLLAQEFFHSNARVLGLTSEGNTIAWRGYAAVSAAKVALESLARSMAVEMAPFGIRTNIIQAGVTDTPALRLIPGSQHLKAQAVRRNPFKRLTQAEDVAGVIALLLSDDASWINGDIIRVDGGEHVAG